MMFLNFLTFGLAQIIKFEVTGVDDDVKQKLHKYHGYDRYEDLFDRNFEFNRILDHIDCEHDSKFWDVNTKVKFMCILTYIHFANLDTESSKLIDYGKKKELFVEGTYSFYHALTKCSLSSKILFVNKNIINEITKYIKQHELDQEIENLMLHYDSINNNIVQLLETYFQKVGITVKPLEPK